MNDKTPKNDTELIAALWGQVRHLQNQLHHVNTQAWAMSGREEVKNSKYLSMIAKNIDELTRCVYETERAKDGTVLFPDPSDVLKRAAVRLVQLGWTTGWSDWIGWDDRQHGWAKQNSKYVEQFNGDAFAEVKE